MHYVLHLVSTEFFTYYGDECFPLLSRMLVFFSEDIFTGIAIASTSVAEFIGYSSGALSFQ